MSWLAAALLVTFVDAIPFTIEGTAAPHEVVTVTIEAYPPLTAVADAGGRWSVEWTTPLETGTYEVRAGDVARIVRVQLPGRLPRQPHIRREIERHEVAPADVAQNIEVLDRWSIVPPPYELNATSHGPLDPYNKNRLKGDYPIRGDDLFLVLTGVSDSLAEARDGGGEEGFLLQNIFVSADLYQGLTTFRPVEQRLKVSIAASARMGDSRRGRFSLQELYYERKLRDLSPNFDFVSLRAGSQPFVSDFRGFLFADTNPGVRLFGNDASNRYQYNVALFRRVQKDETRTLNRFEMLRNQRVAIANFYWQDFLRAGYTQQFSIHHVVDDDLRGTYLGAAGFGHIGRTNIEHAAYYVFGPDVDAAMVAMELSWHRDWLRPRVGFLYREDGFDAIHAAPAFAGGVYSFYFRRASRDFGDEGRPDYTKEGLQLLTTGVDADLTPRLKAIVTANYLRNIGYDLSAGARYRPFLNNHVLVGGGIAALISTRDDETLFHVFTNVVLTF